MKIFGFTTRIFIVLTAIIWIIYDIVQVLAFGNPATESANIWRWAYQLASVDFIFGALVAHLFCEFRPPSTDTVPTPAYVDSFQGIIFVTALTWLGWDAWYAIVGKCCSPVTTAVWAATDFPHLFYGAAPMHQTWIVLFAGGVVGRLFFMMYGAVKF